MSGEPAGGSTVQRLFNDLINLEVNLILKEDMTARKMPLTGEAVVDVADSYHAWLAREGLAGELTILARATEPASDWFKGVCGLAARALAARTAAEEPATASAVVLKRIERNSGQLARIVRGFSPLPAKEGDPWPALPGTIAKEDLLVLRKAWEVSTETVIMQTVAQVDGDIVTRLQPAYAGAGHAATHEAHARFVSTGLEHWRFMFQTLATLASGAFARLLGR